MKVLQRTTGVHLNFSSKLAQKSRLWTHHGLQITDQLFKSNLTFCVVAFTIDSSTRTVKRNLNEHPIYSIYYCFRWLGWQTKWSGSIKDEPLSYFTLDNIQLWHVRWRHVDILLISGVEIWNFHTRKTWWAEKLFRIQFWFSVLSFRTKWEHFHFQ
jgi:hypothetical protein